MPPVPPKPAARRSARAATGGVRGRDGEVLVRARRPDGQGFFSSEFEIPEHLIDPRFIVRGVRTSCMGKPDPANVNAAMQQGFRPCTAKHYPGAFLDKTGDQVLERDGLMLMEQPVEFAEQAAMENRMDAEELRQVQAEAFGGRALPKGFDKGYLTSRQRDGSQADGRKFVRREKPVASPKEFRPSYDYASGPEDD